jgi:hypothetical protein
MKKATKEGTKKGSVKKEKKARVRPEVPAEPAETPVAVEPMLASAAEPEIEAAPVPESADVAETGTPAEVVADAEVAGCPVSEALQEVSPSAPEEVAAPTGQPAEGPADAEPPVDLDTLRKPVENAKAALAAAELDLKQLVDHARAVLTVARDDYRQVLSTYRAACRKAGRPCAFERGRGANVAERVGFLVERTADGVCITIRGRPETMEVLPFATLEESVGKAALAYTDRHIGPKAQIGNKSGGLGNRIRAMLK